MRHDGTKQGKLGQYKMVKGLDKERWDVMGHIGMGLGWGKLRHDATKRDGIWEL